MPSPQLTTGHSLDRTLSPDSLVPETMVFPPDQDLSAAAAKVQRTLPGQSLQGDSSIRSIDAVLVCPGLQQKPDQV